MTVALQLRGDTSANWAAANPVLLARELALTIGASGALVDMRLGDGVTAWSSLSPISLPPSAHTHSIANVTGLQAALDGKQAAGSYALASHGHVIADVTGLQAALDGKQAAGSYAAAAHSHVIADVTGLQAALDGKAASSHTHSIANVTGLQAALDGKQAAGSYAAATHSHVAADVAGLSTLAISADAADLLGNLPIDIFNGGANASATTFWRGDGTWVAVVSAADIRAPRLVTDFAHTNAVQNDFLLAIIGTGASFTTAPASARLGPNHPGVQLWRSGTTANSGVQCFTGLAAFRIGGGEQWDVNFCTAAAFTGTTFRSGAGDSITSTASVDGVFLEFSGSGALVGKCRANNVESVTATIATLVASVWYHGRITVNEAANLVTFSVYDDAGTLLGSQTINANIPTTSGRELGWGSIATNSGTVATDLVHMDRQMLTNPGRTLIRGAP